MFYILPSPRDVKPARIRVSSLIFIFILTLSALRVCIPDYQENGTTGR